MKNPLSTLIKSVPLLQSTSSISAEALMVARDPEDFAKHLLKRQVQDLTPEIAKKTEFKVRPLPHEQRVEVRARVHVLTPGELRELLLAAFILGGLDFAATLARDEKAGK